MKKNIIIIVLTLITVSLGVCVGILLTKDSSKPKEEIVDIATAKSLLDKYVCNNGFSCYFSDLLNGITYEEKFNIAYRNLNESDIILLKDNMPDDVVKDEYSYSIDNQYISDEYYKIDYNKINEVYKSLFGSNQELSKTENVHGTLSYFKYYSNLNSYLQYIIIGGLSGIADKEIYEVSNVKFENNTLRVTVLYGRLVAEDGLESVSYYYPEAKKRYSSSEIENKEFNQQFITDNKDYLNTALFIFEKDNNNYILKNISNEVDVK